MDRSERDSKIKGAHPSWWDLPLNPTDRGYYIGEKVYDVLITLLPKKWFQPALKSSSWRGVPCFRTPYGYAMSQFLITEIFRVWTERFPGTFFQDEREVHPDFKMICYEVLTQPEEALLARYTLQWLKR